MRKIEARGWDRPLPSWRWVGAWPDLIFLVCLAISAGLTGCGAEINSRNSSSGSFDASDSMPTASAKAPPDQTRATPGEMAKAGEEPPPAMPRRIIYNANVDLIVENLSAVEEQLTRLVKESGGYIAETNMASYAHLQRSGTWKVRVPVDRFQSFLAAVAKLGELQRSHLDSQDVSQEYYDLEVRIANKQQEEKRLLKHLDESTGKLQDILAVEREISRVRGEIEQMQGRLKFLVSQTSLSTVTISASELKGYTPPVSPTFATQIARTFRRSLEQLAGFGKGLVLVVVALAPWVPLFALVAWLVWRLFRHQRREWIFREREDVRGSRSGSSLSEN